MPLNSHEEITEIRAEVLVRDAHVYTCRPIVHVY